MRDSYNSAIVAHLLDPAAAITADTKSNYVDVSGYESAEFMVVMGASANLDSGDYFTPVLQHSDLTTDVSFAAVDSADILDAFSAVNSGSLDSTTQRVGYIGDKRYVRVLLDETADTDNGTLIVGVIARLEKGRHNDPTSSDTPTVATAT